MLKPYTMRIARWALVLLVAWFTVAGAAPLDDEIAKLEKQYYELMGKQAWVPLVKLSKQLLELERKRSPKESDPVRQRLQNVGMVLGFVGDLEGQRKIYEEVLAIAEHLHGPDSREVQTALGSLLSAQMSGPPDPVEKTYRRLLELSKKFDGADSAQYAQQQMGYAAILNMHSKYSEAQRMYEEALKLADAKLGNDMQHISLIEQVAGFYWFSVDKNKAIALYDRAIKIARTMPATELMNVGGTLWGVSAIYHSGGRDDLAKPLMAEVIDIYDKEVARLAKDKPDDVMVSQLLSFAAGLAVQQGDLAGAERRIERAIAIDEKAKRKSNHYDTLESVRRAQHRYKDALAILDKERKDAGSNTLMLNMYDLMEADVRREMGDYKKAESLMLSYLKTTEKSYGRRHPYYGIYEGLLANIYLAAGDVPKAETTLADTLEIAEKELQGILATGTEADHTKYMATNAYRVDLVVNFNHTLAPKRASATKLALTTLLRRKGRGLDASAAMMATIRAKLSPEDQKLLDDLASARNQLAKLTVAGPSAAGDPDTYAKEIARLEDLVQNLEIKIGQKSAAYRAVTTPIELSAIQKAIPQGSRLVELVNYQPFDAKNYGTGAPLPPRRYAAYVLAQIGDPTFVDLGSATDIEAAVEKFRKALSSPKSTNVADLGKAMYDLTIGKIQPALGNATDVLIAPDGALALVPFSALVDGKGKYLVETYNFTYLTSGRDLLRLKVQSKARGGGVIFADPAFDAKSKKPAGGSRGRRSSDLADLSWPALPGTGQEGAAVAKTMKNLKLVTGPAATETAVKQMHGPRILHLATHGFFLPDEVKPPPPGASAAGTTPPGAAYDDPLLRSGLALAGANQLSSGDDDGILTSLEASGLDLEGTKLVVLSACETGVGKVSNGDGVYGLRRALIIAGAQSLVMSLWQVDDAGTRDLMVGYYQRLAQGHGKATALREIQLEMEGSAKYKHPYYWAAFLPAGANTPITD